MSNFIENVKFHWKCQILLKMSNFIENFKFQWNCQILLKKSNLIEKVNMYCLFRSLSIEFKLFNYICSWFNQFCCDDWFGFQEFRSKKWFKYNTNTKFFEIWLRVHAIAQAYWGSVWLWHLWCCRGKNTDRTML